MATITPTGYYILVEMEVVEETTESGIILHDKKQLDREQGGHSVGTVRAFGNTVYQGFEGIDGRATKEERAAAWGINLGNKVEFNRYDGKVHVRLHGTPARLDFVDASGPAAARNATSRRPDGRRPRPLPFLRRQHPHAYRQPDHVGASAAVALPGLLPLPRPCAGPAART